MSAQGKANTAACTDRAPVELRQDARFLNGEQITADAGGVVVSGGQYFSLSRPELVPHGEFTQQTESGLVVPANRIGRISLLEHSVSQPTTYGFELEAARMNEEGRYADLPPDKQLEINEVFTFMTEGKTEPTDDPEEYRRRQWGMVRSMVEEAEAAEQYLAPLAVFGQCEPGPEHLNPSPYVVHVAKLIAGLTGFDPVRLFRAAGAQPHTGLSNSQAAIWAAEAMQYLNPIFMAATLCGPLAAGGLAGNLGRAEFTAQQQAHLARGGVTREDLGRKYLSLRYLLRWVALPSAGIWRTPPPDNLEDYMDNAHAMLAGGEINSIDRANGWHADRLRLVLDGEGANTFEGCAFDPALGNPDTNVPLHLLLSGITTALEAMGMRGIDPREEVAKKLGIACLNRQQRLNHAHELSLRQISVHGNDTRVYGGRRPGEWLPDLLELAEKAPFTRIGQDDRQRLAKMYGMLGTAKREVSDWCTKHGTTTLTAAAWFELGIDNPAVYMKAHYDQLREDRPDAPDKYLIREVELTAAKALHDYVSRSRQAA